MNRNRRLSKGKSVKPTFFVFCEGETEQQYVNFLRTKYRLPIYIDSNISGSSITERHIVNYKKDKTEHPKDKTYLFYDLDVSVILVRLLSIKKNYAYWFKSMFRVMVFNAFPRC